MRSRLCMSVVLGVGLLVPGVAMAADADSIRQAIESYLTEASAEMEDASIAYDDLTVTAAGAGHDVSLKGLAIENDEGLLVDFGDQRFSVEEKGDDFAFSNLALTDSVSVTREQEQKKAVVSWFLKRASGTWSPALKGFKSFDMEMGDVKVTLDEGGESSRQMVATLGDLAIEAVTDEVSDRDWNQASRLSVGPIAVRDPEGDGSLSVAKISIDSAVTNMNPTIYKQQVDLFRQLEAAHEANDPARVEALKDRIRALGLVAQGGQGGLVIQGLEFTETRGDQTHFVLEESSIAFRASAPAGEKTGSMGLDFLGVGAKYESRDLHREDQIVASLAPRDWTVNIQLSKLPIKETGNAIMEILFAGVGIQDEPMIPFPQIMAAMGRAGSEVLIDSLSLVGPLVSLDGNAKATVDPASALGAVGGATLKLIGLARLEAAMADFPKDMQQEIAGGLVFLKGLGAPEPDGDDIDYVYVFDVPADGNVTLNGQPMGALLGN